MPRAERIVAGLGCFTVLAELSRFVDGELTGAEVERLRAHVRGCDVCERFGDDFAAVVGSLRRLGEPVPLDPDTERRLRVRLAAVLG